MGMSRIRKQQFFAATPNCVFCGGSTPATTIEHCPPKSMFDNKEWPEGFEFSSCSACNNGTSDQDLIVAWMARVDFTDQSQTSDQRTIGLLKLMHLQHPQMVRKMLPSSIEARRTNRLLGITPPQGKTHTETCVINITPEMTNAIHTFAKKLAKGVYFMHTQKIFPSDGCLMLGWFTNVEFVKKSGFVPFDVIKDVAGTIPPVVRNGKSLDNRFSYKLSISANSDLFVLQAMFGNSFGLLIFGATQAGQLEGIIEKIRLSTDKLEGPLTVLQSTTLDVASQ
jgi:hypothetical protein